MDASKSFPEVHKRSTFSFDDEPLPTNKTSHGFSQNANRSKASSIIFGDSQPPPMPKIAKPPSHFCENPTKETTGDDGSATNRLKQELRDAKLEKDKIVSNKENEIKILRNEVTSLKSELDKSKADVARCENSAKAQQKDMDRILSDKENLERSLKESDSKLKGVQTQADCKLANAEAARLLLEKKLKEQEREFNVELKTAQSAQSDLEKQLIKTEEVNEKNAKALQTKNETLEMQKM